MMTTVIRILSNKLVFRIWASEYENLKIYLENFHLMPSCLEMMLESCDLIYFNY